MFRIIFLYLVNTAFIHCLTCDEVLEIPPDKKLTMEELQTIPPSDVVQCLAHLGRERMATLEAEFIWKSIVNFYDGIENIPDSALMLLQWITVAITPEDYSNITFNNIDVIQNFGQNYELTEPQMSALAGRVREDFAGKEPEDYTVYDLNALGQILCAFNKSEIERIAPLAYKEAATTIGKLEGCNPESMMGFATLAVQRKAFGDPDSWTDATIKMIGKVADFVPKVNTQQTSKPA